MPTLRFIQLSDLHLGVPFAWLTAERRAERRREQQRALDAAIAAALERRASAILVPGDLFDAEGVDAATLAFAVHAFDRSGCPPVFIAPGNHDPATTGSPYWNERLLAARGWGWARHVHVFSEPAWSCVDLRDAPISVWGRSFVSGASTSARPLEARALPEPPALNPSRLHVAVFHGSREDACPPGQTVVAPFSVAEVLASPFVYAAAGHYHRASRVTTPDGAGVKLAYAGSTLALSAAEPGDHGVLEVRLDTETRRVEVEPIVLDERRVIELTVDASGATSAAAIDQRLSEAMVQAGAGERDIVRAAITGRIVRGVRYEAAGPEPASRVFALRTDVRRLRPDHDLEGLKARVPTTTEDRFAHALLAQLDLERDPERRARVLSALYYGLDAFRLQEVSPGWEELEAPVQEAEA